MSVWGTFLLCLSFFAIGVSTAAHAFAPERFPLNLCEIGGWFAFMAAIILWEVSK